MAAEQKTGTIKVGSLAADETKKVAVKLSAGKLSGDVPTLVMKAEVSYEYQAEGQTRTGSDREDILLPVAADNGKNFVDNSGETNSAEASNSGGDSRITAAGETAVTRAATQAPVTEQEAVRQRAERRSWTP